MGKTGVIYIKEDVLTESLINAQPRLLKSEKLNFEDVFLSVERCIKNEFCRICILKG